MSTQSNLVLIFPYSDLMKGKDLLDYDSQEYVDNGTQLIVTRYFRMPTRSSTEELCEALDIDPYNFATHDLTNLFPYDILGKLQKFTNGSGWPFTSIGMGYRTDFEKVEQIFSILTVLKRNPIIMFFVDR